ncbi:hypothetical protein E2562_032620 [Oryza meyeriana var. granulata]|uniref:Uncharacterized protein n=1 Tax=Oryza meyeriana var. granulata TaxID=110450 RepID=A0A6G1DAA5_9ORYZ|nr:hypothetical protein E2562_032620 [Oryza meyeriana var. granulata]
MALPMLLLPETTHNLISPPGEGGQISKSSIVIPEDPTLKPRSREIYKKNPKVWQSQDFSES